jgi:mxaA protein
MWRRVFFIAMWATAHAASLAATQLSATTREPRAFGYQLGDVVARAVTVHVPDGLVLVDASVPQPGARGKALELRGVQRRSSAEAGGRRIELRLEYQVFLSPPQVRTLEMPTFTLRFEGAPRAQELRIDAWPVTVSPLAPVDVSPRRGLGELLPDVAPPPIDTSAGSMRLAAYAVASLLLLAYLGHVYLGLPAWRRAHRPFAQAWRALRGSGNAQPRAAFQRVHEALNRTAGEVVFEQGIERFVAEQPRFAPLRGELVIFFQRSRHEFFAVGQPGGADSAWLTEFCRRCRDAERGSA